MVKRFWSPLLQLSLVCLEVNLLFYVMSEGSLRAALAGTTLAI